MGRGGTKGVARPQPRGDKGVGMKGRRCMHMGALPEDCELSKLVKNTYYVYDTRDVVPRGVRGGVVPSHGRGGGERRG